MRGRPNVAIVLHVQEKPYHYVQIRGKIVEITEEGARQHINDLSYKYTGNPEWKLSSSAGENVMPDTVSSRCTAPL